jgi:triacylglycerol lipase
MKIASLRSPIVMVHGLLGFDRFAMAGWVLADYFRGIPDALRAAGNRVLVARLSPTGGIADRAAQLKEQIDKEYPTEPIHLISHSMGGLDSRYMITHLGMSDRVLSLTTLGTPHRGTAFASWGVRRFAPLLQPVFKYLGLPHQAFLDLTVERCREFNDKTPDVPKVRYFSVAGKISHDWLHVQWQVPSSILDKIEGDNDGIVSVQSARYGENAEVWEGDHLSLINWPHVVTALSGTNEDRMSNYATLVGRLADVGF